MKKEYVPTFLLIVLLIAMLVYHYCFFDSNEGSKVEIKDIKVVPTLVTKLENNSIWCAPFQLIWNDLKNDIVKDNIVFVGDENNQTVLDLNKETITINDLSEKYYYKKHGFMTLDLKKEIEKGIKDKFNVTSDILDDLSFEQNSPNYLLYAMLFRKFEFTNPFDILDDETFGINHESDVVLRDNVKVLYYDDYDNYAVKLITKDNDEVILVKGKNNKNNFLEIFNDINLNNESNFLSEDTITISNLNFKLTTTYKDLINKQIKNTDFIISDALQMINFTLDNTGGKVKSEAAITFKNTASSKRHFNFQDNYVLFLKEKDKAKPYFAMKVDNIEKFK